MPAFAVLANDVFRARHVRLDVNTLPVEFGIVEHLDGGCHIFGFHHVDETETTAHA